MEHMGQPADPFILIQFFLFYKKDHFQILIIVAHCQIQSHIFYKSVNIPAAADDSHQRVFFQIHCNGSLIHIIKIMAYLSRKPGQNIIRFKALLLFVSCQPSGRHTPCTKTHMEEILIPHFPVKKHSGKIMDKTKLVIYIHIDFFQSGTFLCPGLS